MLDSGISQQSTRKPFADSTKVPTRDFEYQSSGKARSIFQYSPGQQSRSHEILIVIARLKPCGKGVGPCCVVSACVMTKEAFATRGRSSKRLTF